MGTEVATAFDGKKVITKAAIQSKLNSLFITLPPIS